jgi:prepilin-type processing-associated H-X9-DG protein
MGYYLYPTTLAQIQYPADTPTFYDGYIVGEQPVTIAVPRHTQTANVAYADGHSKAFHMSMQQNCGSGNAACLFDSATQLWVNQYYIDHGPYRANPGANLNAGFNGIVPDPTCTGADGASPQTLCITGY